MSLNINDNYCSLSRLLGRFEGQRDAAMLAARRYRAQLAAAEPDTLTAMTCRSGMLSSVREARIFNQAVVKQVQLIHLYSRS